MKDLKQNRAQINLIVVLIIIILVFAGIFILRIAGAIGTQKNEEYYMSKMEEEQEKREKENKSSVAATSTIEDIFTKQKQNQKEKNEETAKSMIYVIVFGVGSIALAIGIYKLYKKLFISDYINKSILLTVISFVLLFSGAYLESKFITLIGTILYWISGVSYIVVMWQYFKATGIAPSLTGFMLIFAFVCEASALWQSSVQTQIVMIFAPFILFEILYLWSNIKLADMFSKGPIVHYSIIALGVVTIGTMVYALINLINNATKYLFYGFGDFIGILGFIGVLMVIPPIFQAYLGYNKNETIGRNT